MKQLAKYLFERLILDFENVELDEVRVMLRDEDSQTSRAILAKLVEDQGLDNLLVTIADCLKDELRNGVDDACIEAQLNTYSES